MGCSKMSPWTGQANLYDRSGSKEETMSDTRRVPVTHSLLVRNGYWIVGCGRRSISHCTRDKYVHRAVLSAS